MGKSKEKEHVNRSGTCITFACRNPRESGTWYCESCRASFKADQDKRRGTIGSYPKGFNQVTMVRGSDGADAVVTVQDGVTFDPPIRLKGGVILAGEYAGEKWKDVKGQILDRAGHEGKKESGVASHQCIIQGCVKRAPNGYKTCNDHASLEPESKKVWSPDQASLDWGKQTVNKPPCDNGGQGHDGTKPVVVLADGRTLYGAKGSNLTAKTMEHLDLVIDCAGVVAESGKFVKSAPAKYRRLNAGLLPDVIRLDWPDMTAPVHVGIRFWQRLLELLPAHTGVCCMGGHGRTGTCLAALLVASGMDGEAAIVAVRTRHCKRAIETAGQEAYIKALSKARDEQEKEKAPVVEAVESKAEGGV